MRKIVAAINMTIDGYCDHTAGIPDDELHQHYAELLDNADIALYGRVTYKLMEYWENIIKNPTGIEYLDNFAASIDRIQKIVFSTTLTHLTWRTAKLAQRDIEEEVLELRKQAGGDILVGSPGLIVSLTRLGLIDEYQLCVHPVITGSGLPLFKNISNRIVLSLIKTKAFKSGSVILYYKPVDKE